MRSCVKTVASYASMFFTTYYRHINDTLYTNGYQYMRVLQYNGKINALL